MINILFLMFLTQDYMKKRTNNYLGRDFKKKRENDKISPEKRSKVMSKIRSKNTKFEKDFIVELRKNVPRHFDTHVRTIKGNPDIVFKSLKVCVFLDSDFWHGWQYPRWKHLMKNEFWREKIARNRERNRETTSYLRRNGWKVLRFWEHQIKQNKQALIEQIKCQVQQLN